jgi:cytochrome c
MFKGRVGVRIIFAAVAGAAVALVGAIVVQQAKGNAGASHRISAAELASLKPPADTFAPVFEPCAHCHQIGKGARISTGPVLTGIIGRPAASTNYPYSKAMRDSGLIWDETTLRAFLANPRQMVPGTRMIFPGLANDQMDALVAFLKSESDQR